MKKLLFLLAFVMVGCAPYGYSEPVYVNRNPVIVERPRVIEKEVYRNNTNRNVEIYRPNREIHKDVYVHGLPSHRRNH